MADLVLDTNILADLIAEFFKKRQFELYDFSESRFMSDNVIRFANKIIKWHLDIPLFYDKDALPGYIVVSTIALLEIARKFDEISLGRFTIEQMAAFVQQPPDWLLIETVDHDLLNYLCNLPPEVQLDNGDIRPIEWADAIHVATALSRGEDCSIATTDRSIQAITIIEGKLIK